jgi:hypothetical protein
MAQELKPSNVKFTVDGKLMEFIDESVYTDQSRTDLAIFWTGVYKAIAGDIVIEPEPYLYTEASKFYIPIYADGHHALKMVAFPAVSAPAEADVAEGAVVWNTDALELWQNQAGVFFAVEIADVLDKALAVKDVNVFPVVNNTFALNDLMKVSLDDLFSINMDDHCARTETIIRSNEYDLLYLRLETILGEVCAGNWKIAQRNVEFLNERLTA